MLHLLQCRNILGSFSPSKHLSLTIYEGVLWSHDKPYMHTLARVRAIAIFMVHDY